MRPSPILLVAAVICLLAAGCVSFGYAESAETKLPPRTLIPRPLVERELSSLLLRPEQVDAAVGIVGMAVTESHDVMADNSATMSPPECLVIDGAAEAPSYVDSGFWAERGASLNNGDAFTHYVKQAVVLFPTVELATTFFATSVQRWSVCHEYTHTQSGSQWTVGRLFAENRVLSTVATQQNSAAPGWACERALAVRNNIVVDVNTCSANPAGSATRVASLIADDVTSRW